MIRATFLVVLLIVSSICEGNPVSPAASECGYASCPTGKEGFLNVHLIPHTHDDVGWLKSPDEYFYGDKGNIQKAGVQYILDTVIDELAKNPDRRFIYVESSFFYRWWTSRDDSVHQQVQSLVQSGQLEFIGGGWSMNDEACVHYEDTIDQMTWGFRFLNDTFGKCGVPRIAWQIDPFGHSREVASLFYQMGFDGLLFARIDYQDRSVRIANKNLEMIWDASTNIDAPLFTGAFSSHYSPPGGFCYDVNCQDEPFKDNPVLKGYNVDRIVDNFIKASNDQAANFATDHVLFTMGDDFNYQNAHSWYLNLDKLIYYVNERQSQGSNISVFYSTPSCYVQALNKAGHTWNVKTDDFFPYATDPHAYWTGYYTSRPAFKGYTKITNNILQIGKQLTVYSNLSAQNDDRLSVLRRFQGDAQHHDAVTGTEKQAVTYDYTQSLATGVDSVLGAINGALGALLPIYDSQPPNHVYCPYLNVSYCDATEQQSLFGVTVYNSLERSRTTYIRVPVTSTAYSVFDPTGLPIPSQLLPITEAVMEDPEKLGTAQYDLTFQVDLPASGFATYFVQSTSLETNEINHNQPQYDAPRKSAPTADVVISNEKLSVTVDTDTGLLTSVTDLVTSTVYSVQQNFYYYEGHPGDNHDADSRASGAYIFRPNISTAFPMAENGVNITTSVVGNGVQEIHQTFSDYVSQVIRLKPNDDYVELEWFVGPIPVDDLVGKEIITKYETSALTNGIFYTDANGREILQRVRNYRPTWTLDLEEPTAGNYYPINSKIYIQDTINDAQITIVTDRSHGGSSIEDGNMEVMLHRRLLYDDGFGVGEPLDERGVDGKGLRVRGKHRLYVSSIANAPLLHRPAAIETSNEPLILIAPVTSISDWTLQYKTTYSGIAQPFPENVRLLTLEPWKDDTVLLRLEHFYDKTDDPVLSQPATINVQNLFTNFEIYNLIETTLGANVLLSDVNRFTWDTTNGPTRGNSDYLPEGALDVTLQPMQIRTFVAQVIRK